MAVGDDISRVAVHICPRRTESEEERGGFAQSRTPGGESAVDGGGAGVTILVRVQSAHVKRIIQLLALAKA